MAEEKSILINKPKLPETTIFVQIKGANHSKFGFYGFQFGDKRADIRREQQQSVTLKKYWNL